jgi:Mycothiol maleylpyruvate isomerase N-terminal domain
MTWQESVTAFEEAARWFVATAARVGDRWGEPGLGEWDVRALVGHTSRSLLTVETYLGQPAREVEVGSADSYYRATRMVAAGSGVAERGVAAGAALGDEPPAAVAEIADRVLALVGAQTGEELLTTVAGGMRLSDYLPTRTFELAVHTCDRASALGLPLDVPASAAAETTAIIGRVAAADGTAGQVLLALTGRESLPGGFSVL